MPDYLSSLPDPDQVYDDFLRAQENGGKVHFEALCRAHPAIERELRRLHATQRLLDGILPEPLAGGASGKAGSSANPASQPTRRAGPAPGHDANELIDGAPPGIRHTILKKVRSGGMGIVFLARDKELGRPLALKVEKQRKVLSVAVPPSAASHDRFRREAEITSRLDHPGVPPVFEIGETADGRSYYTMRYVAGRTLTEVFTCARTGQDGWSQLRVLEVLIKVCDTMSFAHSRRVIHRDLKPDNIMVGSFGEATVLDWGLARQLPAKTQPSGDAAGDGLATAPDDGPDPAVEVAADDEDAAAARTRYGDFLGTPSYAAPEQVAGRLDQVDERCDVYALGAILYELLAGVRPYAGTSTTPTRAEIAELVKQGPPPSLRELGMDASPRLVSICERAMQRDRTQRYPTAAALAADLRAYLAGRVVMAHESGALAELRAFVRRNVVRITVGACLFVVSLLAILFWGWERQSSSELALREEVQVVLREIARLDNLDQSWSAKPKDAPSSTYEGFVGSVNRLLYGKLVEGRAPLLNSRIEDYKQELEHLRRQYSRDWTQSPDEFPHALLLMRKEQTVLWYERMLGEKQFPSIEQVAAELRDEIDHMRPNRLNEMAWHCVDPREPVEGEEVRGVVLASAAVNRTVALRYTALAFGHVDVARKCDLYGALARETYARALFRVREFDRARAEMERALATVRAHGRQFPDLPQLEQDIQAWQSEQLPARRAELAELVAERDILRTQRELWLLENSAVYLSTPIVSATAGLERLAARLRLNTEAQGVDADEAWRKAQAAILASPDYAGLRLPRQIDLVPLGEHPESRLWEFGHLLSGDLPRNPPGSPGQLTPRTGIVFVLMPRATVQVLTGYPSAERQTVELDPFFIAKTELTIQQWNRIDRLRPRPMTQLTCPPLADISADEFERVCTDSATFLRLPSAAQWEYACWGRRSLSWFGSGVDLAHSPIHGTLVSAGSTPANLHGLHEMIGNVAELIADGPPLATRPRPRDGLRIRTSQTTIGRYGSDLRAGVALAKRDNKRQWDDVIRRYASDESTGVRPIRRVHP